MAIILIIDDDYGMCWALEKSLQVEGHQVLTATSATEGLNIFNLNLKNIQLVLLDINLGNESGLDVLKKIRKENRSLPVLIMTGYSTMSLALEAINQGATGYLTKPFKMQYLIETIEKISHLPDSGND